MHNVLHFVRGIAIIGFLVVRPSGLAMYMMGFGFFYATIGVVGTVDHKTIDRTFLNTGAWGRSCERCIHSGFGMGGGETCC
jgi:hypothetical protein